MTLILLLRIMHRIGEEYSFNEGYNFIFYIGTSFLKKMNSRRITFFMEDPMRKVRI